MTTVVRVHRWLLAAVTLLYLPIYFVTVVIFAVASLGGAGSGGEVLWAGVLGTALGAIVGVPAMLWARSRARGVVGPLTVVWLLWLAAAALAPVAADQLAQVVPVLVWSAPVFLIVVAFVSGAFIPRSGATSDPPASGSHC